MLQVCYEFSGGMVVHGGGKANLTASLSAELYSKQRRHAEFRRRGISQDQFINLIQGGTPLYDITENRCVDTLMKGKF